MADAVLVVEDDAALSEMMGQLLHLEGFAPVVVSNGLEALKLLRLGFPVKCILLDLMMPIMDGWAFRREQQRDPAIAGIPVIVLSALESRDVDALALFRKPLNFDALIRCVRAACQNASNRALID